MFVIAALVAWMAERRNSTSRRYAALFRRASERLLTVEEDERRRIAGELHDGVGQVLTALTLTLDAAGAEPDPAPPGGTSPPRAGSRIRRSRRRATSRIGSDPRASRSVAWSRPSGTSRRSPAFRSSSMPTATPAIRACSARPPRSRSTGSSRRRWPMRRATAAPPQAEVSITRQDERLTVVVATPAGFDPARSRGRASDWPACWSDPCSSAASSAIDSAPQAGTRVTVSLPIAPAAAARDGTDPDRHRRRPCPRPRGPAADPRSAAGHGGGRRGERPRRRDLAGRGAASRRSCSWT